ncbi:hypothetical protein CH063_11248 [Colletotrichum higginsianum]|uniref:Uncharacterized protein n=1 Tax=Colletotrichum higginsianum (strain IMI 349063) TaxID=759273 RepID=H1VKL3_COLHI|nr:hypothetical protein CH063_11248 [Colletotrichum higginsianum]
MVGSSSRRQHGLHGFDDMPVTTLIMRRATISGRDWFLPLRGIAVPVYRVGSLGLPSPALRRFSTYEILSLEKRSDKIYHWRCLITHALHKGQHWDVTAPGAVSLFFFHSHFSHAVWRRLLISPWPPGMTNQLPWLFDWEKLQTRLEVHHFGVSGTDSIGLLQIGESFLVCVREL